MRPTSKRDLKEKMKGKENKLVKSHPRPDQMRLTLGNQEFNFFTRFGAR